MADNVREIETDRTPPANLAAEQAVIGGLLLRGEALALVSGWLSGADFFWQKHRLIFDAITALAEVDQPFDAVTLGGWFEERGQQGDIGGASYLIELASTTPSAANIVAYAEIVREKAILRNIIERSTETVNDAFSPKGKASREIATIAAARMLELSGGARPRGAKSMRDIGKSWYSELQARYEAGGKLLGIPTPWPEYNRLTSGLHEAELIIVAARPSMGKSAMAVNLAVSTTLAGKRAMYFNLETSATSIYSRAMATLKEIPLEWFRNPADESSDYWGKVSAGVDELNRASLVIDDTPGLTGQQIISRAKREHLKQPLNLVVVDHLHLIPLPGKTRETVEIGHITAGLKGLAKSIGCTVVLLSQLNRGLEARTNKRPTLADLRESGNIEQDGDVIVFLYRDDYYAAQEDRESESPGLMEMIIAKQREGRIGKVWTRFQADIGRIDPADRDDIPAPRPRKSGTKGAGQVKKSKKDAAAGDAD